MILKLRHPRTRQVVATFDETEGTETVSETWTRAPRAEKPASPPLPEADASLPKSPKP